LRANAKWHDGKPVTPEDVIFSLESFKKYHPQYSAYYRHVVKAEKVGEREIKFTFDAPGNRELPQIVGQLTVLPKHWWEGTNASGAQARHRQHHAGECRSAVRLSHQGFRAGPFGVGGACEGLLGLATST
jgi:ABC-type transport system substrate-binding protein